MLGFEPAVEFVFSIEGGFSNDQNDPGNWTGGAVNVGELLGTKFGISAASYPDLDIRNLSDVHATVIYRRDFWNKIDGDDIQPGLDLMLMDCAVNQGVGAAIHILQSAVHVATDGVIGLKTRAAMDAQTPRRNILEVAGRRLTRYGSSPNFGIYGLGWSMRVLRAYEASLAQLSQT